MHMRLFSRDLQFLNLGDRFCNLKKVWWDTVGIGGYALSNTLRFVQLSLDVCFRRPLLDGRKRCENVG